MTRNDDGHKVARIIKGLEERIANLEEKDRSAAIPTLLRKKTDRVTVADPAPTVTETRLKIARWNDSTTASGYQEGGYSEGGYTGRTITDDGGGGSESTDSTAGFGEGGYGDGVYGTGSSSGSGSEQATTGWHTGLWSAYDTREWTELTVDSGETYTIASGAVESYTAASIAGVLEADGTLETE